MTLKHKPDTEAIAKMSNEVHAIAKEHLSFDWLSEYIADPENLGNLAHAFASTFMDGSGLNNIDAGESYEAEEKLRMCLGVVWMEGFSTGLRTLAEAMLRGEVSP